MAKRARRRRESSAALLLEVHCTKLSVGPDTDNAALRPPVPSLPIALALPPSPAVAPWRSSGELRLCFRTGCTSVAWLGGGERSINDERLVTCKSACSHRPPSTARRFLSDAFRFLPSPDLAALLSPLPPPLLLSPISPQPAP